MLLAASLAFAALMLGSAAVVYYAIAWSIDSPVLRRAMRGRCLSRATLLGMVVMALVTVFALRLLGARGVDGASLFFGGMIFLFGSAGVFFLDLVLEDLRDIGSAFFGRLQALMPFEAWIDAPADTKTCAKHPQSCASKSRCGADPRPCDSGILRQSWRAADWQRTRQRR